MPAVSVSTPSMQSLSQARSLSQADLLQMWKRVLWAATFSRWVKKKLSPPPPHTYICWWRCCKCICYSTPLFQPETISSQIQDTHINPHSWPLFWLSNICLIMIELQYEQQKCQIIHNQNMKIPLSDGFWVSAVTFKNRLAGEKNCCEQQKLNRGDPYSGSPKTLWFCVCVCVRVCVCK